MIQSFRKKKQWCLVKIDGECFNPLLDDMPFEVQHKKSWMTYEEMTESRGTEFNPGFILNNDFMGITLAHCFDINGELKEWANNFIAALKGLAYVEIYDDSVNIIIMCNDIHRELKLNIKLSETHKFYREGEGSISLNSYRHVIPMTGAVIEGYDLPRIDSMYFTDLILFMTNITNSRTMVHEVIKEPDRVGSENDILFDEVKKSVTLEQLLIHYGIAKESNRIICPFCKPEKKTFHIFSVTDSWYCFECHQGGDQIDFVKIKNNWTAYQAAAKIAHWFDLPVDPNILLFKNKEHRNVLNACKKINITRKGDSACTLKSKELGIDLTNFGMDQDWGPGLFITHSGVMKRIKRERGYYVDIMISPLIFYPSRVITVNGIDELELCCVMKHKYNITSTIRLVENKDMASLTNWRIFINSIIKPIYWGGNMDDLNMFISYQIKLVDKLKIEKIDAVDKFGWQRNELLPYDKEVFIRDPNLASLQSAFTKRGDWADWVSKVEKLRLTPAFNIIFLTALASLDRVGPKFWLHSTCEWSGGKSAAMKAVASIFGDPIKLTRSFNTTDNGIEYFANVMNNIPVFLDDIQSLSDHVGRERMLYNAISGVGKTRATASGVLPVMNEWRCNFISNGEEGFLPRNVKEGAHKRIIQYSDIPIANIALAEEAHEFFENCYGHLAPKIAKIYIKRLDLMKDVYKQLEKEIAKEDFQCMPEHLKYTLICGKWNYLYETDILGNNVDDSFKATITWIKDISKNLITGGDVSTFSKAIDYIKAFFVQNIAKFKENHSEQYGFVEKTDQGQVLYIFPNVFREILKTNRIEEVRFKRESRQDGLIVVDKQGNTPLKYYKGTRQRIPGIYINKFMSEIEVNKNLSMKKQLVK